jgi:hypothetical protein
MKRVVFIGDIINGLLFSTVIYMPILMSQANGMIPLKLYISANADLRVWMHHRF